MSWYPFKPYVPVAKRRADALRELRKLEKGGRTISPVTTAGRTIASTFWGKAWCDHLESYSDFENRLPRGRTYVRNGSVVDLQIEPGRIDALVSGSELYRVSIRITPLAARCWECIKRDCGGSIGSVIELIQGKLSKAVMERVTRREGGMFPAPAEITKTCSCPDWADVCKHVAAVLYGVGARLDHQPELLFVLRKVDPAELIENAGNVDGLVRADGSAAHHKTLADDQLADVFGIDLEPEAPLPASAAKPRDVRAVRGAASPAASKSPAAGKRKARAGGKKKADSGRGRTAKDGGKVSKARGERGRGRGRRKAPIS